MVGSCLALRRDQLKCIAVLVKLGFEDGGAARFDSSQQGFRESSIALDRHCSNWTSVLQRKILPPLAVCPLCSGTEWATQAPTAGYEKDVGAKATLRVLNSAWGKAYWSHVDSARLLASLEARQELLTPLRAESMRVLSI